MHHCIEKGHLSVLEVMLEHGVDVYSAIELADNAGRTPIFEAIENMPELPKSDDESEGAPTKYSIEIIRILTRKKNENGFGAKINVVNNSG